MDETESILKPETKTERRLITMPLASTAVQIVVDLTTFCRMWKRGMALLATSID